MFNINIDFMSKTKENLNLYSVMQRCLNVVNIIAPSTEIDKNLKGTDEIEEYKKQFGFFENLVFRV